MGNNISNQENNIDVEIKEINKNNPPNPQNFYNIQHSSIKALITQAINNNDSIFSLYKEKLLLNNNNNNININNINNNIIISNNSLSKKEEEKINYDEEKNYEIKILNKSLETLLLKTENISTSNNIITSNTQQILQKNTLIPKKLEYPIKPYYEKIEEEKNTSSIKLDKISSMDLFENPIKYKAGSLLQDIRKIYKFRDNLGGGHFGKVRLGYRRNEKPPPFYAIKSISKRNLTDKDLEDLIKEVDIISCLDHPNIIKFYETYHDKFYFHIVMELCKGKEVFDRIVEDGRIKEKKVCMVIMKVLHAISYCHSRGVTHRDLKPENILFETLDSESEIKLIDFGLSRKVFNDEKMHTILGTPYYVAPEVLQGEYDEKCDIWSIGALTYIMLCGDPPFKGNSNHEIFNKILREDIKFSSKKWEKISDDAKNFVKNCLIKIPDKRPNAIQCLNNLWFKDILNDVHSVNNISVDILNNLKNFSIKEKFTKMVIKYLLNTLTEKEKNIYKKAFYAMDYKHKGTIDIEDLEKSFQIGKVSIKKEDLEKLIKLVDENGKNSLDYTELLIAGINKQKLFNEEKLKMAFQYFDVNNSGIIEISDLKDAMLRFGKKIIYSDDVNKLIQEVTKNMNKDCLNWEDFINIFKEIQNEE